VQGLSLCFRSGYRSPHLSSVARTSLALPSQFTGRVSVWSKVFLLLWSDGCNAVCLFTPPLFLQTPLNALDPHLPPCGRGPDPMLQSRRCFDVLDLDVVPPYPFGGSHSMVVTPVTFLENVLPLFLFARIASFLFTCLGRAAPGGTQLSPQCGYTRGPDRPHLAPPIQVPALGSHGFQCVRSFIPPSPAGSSPVGSAASEDRARLLIFFVV